MKRNWKHDKECELEKGDGLCGCWWRNVKGDAYVRSVRDRSGGTEYQLVSEIDRLERIVENLQTTVDADEIEMNRLRHQHTIGGSGIPISAILRLLDNSLANFLRDGELSPEAMQAFIDRHSLDRQDIATCWRIAAGEKYA